MNGGGAQAFLILAIIALFFAVVVAPVLARILDGQPLGPASLGATRAGSPAFGSSGFNPLEFGSARFEAPGFQTAGSVKSASLASGGRGVQRNARGLAGAPHASPKRGHEAWDLPDDLPEDPDELDRMIDIDRVEGRLKSGAINKVMQLVDRHPQAAAAVLRGWIHRED